MTPGIIPTPNTPARLASAGSKEASLFTGSCRDHRPDRKANRAMVYAEWHSVGTRAQGIIRPEAPRKCDQVSKVYVGRCTFASEIMRMLVEYTARAQYHTGIPIGSCCIMNLADDASCCRETASATLKHLHDCRAVKLDEETYKTLNSAKNPHGANFFPGRGNRIRFQICWNKIDTHWNTTYKKQQAEKLKPPLEERKSAKIQNWRLRRAERERRERQTAKEAVRLALTAKGMEQGMTTETAERAAWILECPEPKRWTKEWRAWCMALAAHIEEVCPRTPPPSSRRN